MTDKIIVIHSDGTKENFKPRIIAQTIISETKVDKQLADRIQDRIAKKLYKLKQHEGLTEISTSDLRAEVSSQLLKEGQFEAVEQNRKLGMSVAEFEHLLEYGCKDNANIGYSPEMIAKYAYDSIAKEYALLKMPEECAEAHREGLMHIHDLEYYMTRPNCLSGNNKIIIKDSQGVVSYIRLDDFVEKWQSNMEDYYVPSFNYNSCVMEWNKVENAYKSSDKEQVYSVKFNKGYRIECTSDHKFIKSHNNKPCKDYDIKVSEFDHYKDLRLINLTDIHDYNSDNDYYKSALFGLFLGDGNISKNGAVKFSFSKTDKAEYCDGLLKKIGLKYSYNVHNSSNYQNGLRHDFYIIDRIYPNKSKSQLICHFKNQLNLKGVFEGLVNSDGCVVLDKNNIIRCNFTSTNKDIFDLYYLCLISLGLRGSISIHKPTNNNHSISYNSSTFGSRLLKLFDEITLRDTFQEYHNQANKKCKQYQEISEITPKSIEYIGEMPVYNLTIENNHNYLAGVDGFILTQNCMNYDLRFFARNGLKIDGKGEMGSVAKPAKSLEVLLNHMLQAWMAGATVFSGGQGYVSFNTLLAPFCKGRSYEDIKQAIQGFIFNCNMSLICRGGQVLFSSIALDLSIPEVLKDEPAISFGGVSIGTYKDYQEEADLIFRAVCEVSNEKDGAGAYHRFPNILFNIRKGDLDEYKGTCKILHETGANNPTIYYNNCIDLERSTMGCRSSLPMNYRGNYEEDCVNTGNFMYNTINLPLIALEANGDWDDFLNKLNDICEICYTSLKHRREVVIDAVYNKHMSDFLLQTDKESGEPLWDIDRTTITIGYAGLNECLMVLFNDSIENEDVEDKGVCIIEFLNQKKQEFFDRDGLRWSVIASPAESTAFRFATINKEKYPQAPAQGAPGAYYVTNSHHIPVKSGVSWIRHIQNANKFAHLSLGGDILHIWSGEVWSDPEAIWRLNQRILKYGNPIFWAYSKAFTFCRDCQFTINDKLEVCPICGSTNLRLFDRITGYYLSIDTFNAGKRQEFADRHRHIIQESDE